jgi:hypothetical protein
MTADAATQLADAKRIIFAPGGCFRSLDSARIEIEEGENPPTDCLRNDLHAKWN